jgi:hypothetical protein
MTSHLHHEIARARQQEIAARAIHAHDEPDRRGTGNPRRPIRRRFAQAGAALSVLAVVTAAAVTGADANPRHVQSGRVTAQQLAREIGALERKGYQQASCTVGGTLMTNYKTGQSVTVEW